MLVKHVINVIPLIQVAKTVFFISSKLSALVRPCKRCIEKGIAHLCQDNNQKRARKFPEDVPDPTPHQLVATPLPQPPVTTPPITTPPTPSTPSTVDSDLDLSQYNPEMKTLILNLLLSVNTDVNSTNPAEIFSHIKVKSLPSSLTLRR